MKKVLVSIMFVMVFSAISFAGDYVVIVNPANSTSSVAKSMLKRLYTGRATELDGTTVIPINLILTSPVAESFLDEVVGLSSAEYKEFWVAQQIKGAGTAPMSQATDAAIISMVSSIPGAIGYISAGSETDAVKVITVN